MRASAMVVAQESAAARIGVSILDRGGNAVDAAVAVGFALAVTYPRAGNLGGGGFMVIHLAKTSSRKIAASPSIIARPRRRRRRRRCSSNDKGEPDPAKSRDSALSIGVPGTVAGLALAHQKYGSGQLTLAELIAPAINLARMGFIIRDDLADSLPRARDRLMRWPSSRVFMRTRDRDLRQRRPADPARSRRHVAGHCRYRPRRLLPGQHRHADRQRR